MEDKKFFEYLNHLVELKGPEWATWAVMFGASKLAMDSLVMESIPREHAQRAQAAAMSIAQSLTDFMERMGTVTEANLMVEHALAIENMLRLGEVPKVDPLMGMAGPTTVQ